MKDFELDAQLRQTLHDCVDGMTTDDALKARIDFMVKGTTKKRKVTWKKVTVGLAAALCLTTVGAFASGQIAGLISSTAFSKNAASASELQDMVGEVAAGIQVPETLLDQPFSEGRIDYTDKMDESGNRFGTYPAVSADYGALSLSARAYDDALDGETADPGQTYDGQPRETREIDGVTVAYQADRYLFLPADAQPTEQEQQLADNNELYISYGTDTRSEEIYQTVTWQSDGVVYSLSTSDATLTADDLFDAAAEAIAA